MLIDDCSKAGTIDFQCLILSGPAEEVVPGVHVHPLFFGETPKNLTKTSLSLMPFALVYRAPPVFITLRRACSLFIP